MKFAERVAKQLLETHLSGSRMEFRDVQANGEPDFDLRLADGSRQVVEVTSAVNQKHVESRQAISNPGRGGLFVPVVIASNSWYIHLTSDAKVNEVRKRVDAMLAAIEETGRSEFFAPIDSHDNPAVQRIWTELGVEHGRVTVWKHGKYIGLGSPGQFTWVSAIHILNAVNAALSKADNIRKLSPDDGSRSHLFLWIDSSSYDAWAAMQRSLMPDARPRLPERTTGVWVAAITGLGKAIKLIYFDGNAWADLGVNEFEGQV